jgi:hypothetical protein
MTRLFAFLAAAAVLLFAVAWCLPPAGAQSGVEWDSRLNALNITYHPAGDCSQGCWKLVRAEYLDEGQSAGLHHVFAKTLNPAGHQIIDRFTVAWADGSVTVDTKAPPDWGDVALWDCYFPDQGEPGGYRAYAGLWESQSDSVRGLGLPYCWHVSFRLTWQWIPAGNPTPTPAPTATPTPTPPPPLPFRLGLPLVSKH